MDLRKVTPSLSPHESIGQKRRTERYGNCLIHITPLCKTPQCQTMRCFQVWLCLSSGCGAEAIRRRRRSHNFYPPSTIQPSITSVNYIWDKYYTDYSLQVNFQRSIKKQSFRQKSCIFEKFCSYSFEGSMPFEQTTDTNEGEICKIIWILFFLFFGCTRKFRLYFFAPVQQSYVDLVNQNISEMFFAKISLSHYLKCENTWFVFQKFYYHGL